jgi:serine/threonine protein kinase
MTPLGESDPTRLGEYELLGRIGSGGFGVVYQAEAPDGRAVAIKLLRPEFSDDEGIRARLSREAEALSRVVGDRTVEIIDVVVDGPQAFLVMELVEGENLGALVQRNGKLEGPMLWFAAEGLVEALKSIHQAGVIHRDLKPSNVMYGPEGVKVLDFGISAVAEEAGLTQTGTLLGSAAWLSPEQVQGGRFLKVPMCSVSASFFRSLRSVGTLLGKGVRTRSCIASRTATPILETLVRH